jgi:hypothetical protein
MAEIKFSCPQCGQHISGNEQWSGRQIQCPVCATSLTVPGALPPPAAAVAAPQLLVPQPPASRGPRLSAGATQVTRAPAPGAIPIRQLAERPPKRVNPWLKYAVYALVLGVLGGAGYLYGPTLLSKVQGSTNSKPIQVAPNPNAGGAGPLGEVNGAMDISDTLDGGGSPAPRPGRARPPVVNQRPTTPAANPVARSTNITSRARSRLPR